MVLNFFSKFSLEWRHNNISKFKFRIFWKFFLVSTPKVVFFNNWRKYKQPKNWVYCWAIVSTPLPLKMIGLQIWVSPFSSIWPPPPTPTTTNYFLAIISCSQHRLTVLDVVVVVVDHYTKLTRKKPSRRERRKRKGGFCTSSARSPPHHYHFTHSFAHTHTHTHRYNLPMNLRTQ